MYIERGRGNNIIKYIAKIEYNKNALIYCFAALSK